MRPSLVAGAGRGCFAATALPAGTVLGAYPGRLRSAAEYATKLRVVGPHVAEYCWRIGDVAALDPTDGEGRLYEARGTLTHQGSPLLSAPSAQHSMDALSVRWQAPGVPLIEGMPESLRTGAMANWCELHNEVRSASPSQAFMLCPGARQPRSPSSTSRARAGT